LPVQVDECNRPNAKRQLLSLEAPDLFDIMSSMNSFLPSMTEN